MAETREYEMRTWIQGLRDGKPWPKVGETIELDEEEARDMLALRYVGEINDQVETRPAPAAPATRPAAPQVPTPAPAETREASAGDPPNGDQKVDIAGGATPDGHSTGADHNGDIAPVNSGVPPVTGEPSGLTTESVKGEQPEAAPKASRTPRVAAK